MVVIVTRHEGHIKWLARKGIVGKAIPHATPDDVRGEVVIGILPFNLAALTKEIIHIDLPGLTADQRGKELSPEEMDAAGAVLHRYVVREVFDGVPEV